MNELDVTKVLSGKDGQIFVSAPDGTQIPLAEANTSQAKMNVASTKIQPLGCMVEQSIPTGISVAFSFEEIVIRDDVMLEPLFDALAAGYIPTYSFQTKLSRRDGQEQRMVYRNAMPDGEINLLDLKAGQQLSRPWNFVVNALPELLKMFTSAT
jgi:hypothetical protein